MRQTVQILKRAQHVEVIDGLRELPLLHHWTNEDGRNLVVAGVVVFIPGHDQQAVVGVGKLNITINVLLQPGIALRDGSVMHIVIEVRDDERERRQRREIRGEAGERLIGCGGNVGEIDPGRVLARIGPGSTDR